MTAQWCFHSTCHGQRFHSPKNALYEEYSLQFISIFWHNISLSLEELVPVMVCLNKNYHFPGGGVVFVATDFFFFHMSHSDEMLIIKLVFIVLWNISLGPFCWRISSDCTIIKLAHHVAWLHSDRPTWEMIWKKKFLTFDLHILPEQRHIGCTIFPVVVFEYKKRSVLTHLLTIETVSKLSRLW